MLRQTFLHLPFIGRLTERRLWAQGVRNWDSFLQRWDSLELFPIRREVVRRELLASQEALAAEDFNFFASRLPPGERWRCWEEFKRSACFLDCETTGLSPERDDLTVIGVADFNGRVKHFVKGENLNDFPAFMNRFGLMVTFNGASFDSAFLRANFPRWRWDGLHWDARWTLKRCGFAGGLKAIEEQFGMQREEELRGLRGVDAVEFWERWQSRGDSAARDLLLKYNAADVLCLKPLAERAYVLSRAAVLESLA